MTRMSRTESRLILVDEFIVFQILEQVFVDVHLKRLRYYSKERDRSVVAGVR